MSYKISNKFPIWWTAFITKRKEETCILYKNTNAFDKAHFE